jgi:hypothetical protein
VNTPQIWGVIALDQWQQAGDAEKDQVEGDERASRYRLNARSNNGVRE